MRPSITVVLKPQSTLAKRLGLLIVLAGLALISPTGVVLDVSGSVVAGAGLKLISEDIGAVRVLATDRVALPHDA